MTFKLVNSFYNNLKNACIFRNAGPLSYCHFRFSHNTVTDSFVSSLEPLPGAHIGTYFSTIKPLVDFQNNGEQVSLCISDMQALSKNLSRDEMKGNIFSTVALFIACGIDPNKVTLYQQSKLPEHLQLVWLLNCCIERNYPETISSHAKILNSLKDLKLGQYMSPILECCNFLINRANYIPSGRNMMDTVENIQYLTDLLNKKSLNCLPFPSPWVQEHPHDIFSLKDPTQIMSRKDRNVKNRIEIFDSPDLIFEKCKKAVTDFNSKVYWDKINRPGVSNLMAIHSLVTGKDFDTIADESKFIETAEYKMIVADSIIEYLEPIQIKYKAIVEDKEHLVSIINTGNMKARAVAESTLRTFYDDFGFNSKSVLNTIALPVESSIDDTQSKTFQCKHIFSGIQPTGNLHLGNYFGAVKQWVNLIKEGHDVIICIVDQHAVTIPQNKNLLQKSIINMAASLIACGVDPDESILFQQSRVSEHAQLYGILSNIVPVATLARQAHYKDKIQSLETSPSLGLFSYPVLQSADILLYKTSHVPVGEDQKQHIELAREISLKFNRRFGNIFKKPHPMILDNSVARLKSLCQPTKKMSKSESDVSSRIEILDSPEIIQSKISNAVIESDGKVLFDQRLQPGISNLMTMHSIISGETFEKITADNSTLDPNQYKDLVADVVIEHLNPIRQKALHLMSDEIELNLILEAGARKAKSRAQKTLQEIHEILGFSL